MPALNLKTGGLTPSESVASTQAATEINNNTESKTQNAFYTTREATEEHKIRGMQSPMKGEDSAKKQTKEEMLADGNEEKKKKKRRKKNKGKKQNNNNEFQEKKSIQLFR